MYEIDCIEITNGIDCVEIIYENTIIFIDYLRVNLIELIPWKSLIFKASS